MTNILISVIIPVFNAEKYLDECIKSILNQSEKNIEIIIIDDGSTDNSYKICLKYQKEDKRIKIFRQENKGVSSARNLGIQNSLGKYLYFMDADDVLNKSMFYDFLNLNVDDDSLYAFGWKKYYKDTNINDLEIKRNTLKKLYNLKEIILLDTEISSFLFNKIYLRKIILDNHILFDEDIHYCEDMKFNYSYINYVRTLTYNDKKYYYYRMRKNSATGNYVSFKNLSVFNVFEYFIKDNQDNPLIYYNYCFAYIINYYKFRRKFKNYNFNEKIINKKMDVIKSKYISIRKKIKLIFYNTFSKLVLFRKNKYYNDKLFE